MTAKDLEVSTNFGTIRYTQAYVLIDKENNLHIYEVSQHIPTLSDMGTKYATHPTGTWNWWRYVNDHVMNMND